jgi:hypothetical protein
MHPPRTTFQQQACTMALSSSKMQVAATPPHLDFQRFIPQILPLPLVDMFAMLEILLTHRSE